MQQQHLRERERERERKTGQSVLTAAEMIRVNIYTYECECECVVGPVPVDWNISFTFWCAHISAFMCACVCRAFWCIRFSESVLNWEFALLESFYAECVSSYIFEMHLCAEQFLVQFEDETFFPRHFSIISNETNRNELNSIFTWSFRQNARWIFKIQMPVASCFPCRKFNTNSYWNRINELESIQLNLPL